MQSFGAALFACACALRLFWIRPDLCPVLESMSAPPAGSEPADSASATVPVQPLAVQQQVDVDADRSRKRIELKQRLNEVSNVKTLHIAEN